MGWVGRQGDLLNVLEDEGADKDPEGHFLVATPTVGRAEGEPFTYSTFMGQGGLEAEILIGDSLRYRKANEWLSLADLMRSRGSHGVSVKVF